MRHSNSSLSPPITVHYDNDYRITGIDSQAGVRLARFEYRTDLLLASSHVRGAIHHYTWSAIQSQNPATIAWVKPLHLLTIDNKSFDYTVNDETIEMIAHPPNGKRTGLKLHTRYGTIISIKQIK